jgi:hypothetical protein
MSQACCPIEEKKEGTSEEKNGTFELKKVLTFLSAQA